MSQSNHHRRIDTQAALDRAVYEVCNILRRDKAKGARLYVPELTWMLFLCALDAKEREEDQRAAAVGQAFMPTLSPPYRWRDWAAEFDRRVALAEAVERQLPGWKRQELTEGGSGCFLEFVNGELFPHLRGLREADGSTNRQKVVGEIFANKEQTVVASETNLLDCLDGISRLHSADISDRHMFPLSQAFEGLLPRLGEKQNDGGQFFTPREIIRVIVRTVNPQLGGTVYDPCCGTGGFLIEAFKHLMGQNPTSTQVESLKTETLWAREDASEAIPLCLANMMLHGIDLPRIWHGNTLTGAVTYEGLFEGAPAQFEYVMTNPPFGSKEGKTAQAQFAFKSGKAQLLFVQHIIDALADGGTCGMVIDEGVLFHTKTRAYQQVKRKLMDECDLWCIVSLPPGVFVNAGAGVKTNLLFFTKGRPTQRVCYYDLTHVHVTKKTPLTVEHFDDFLTRLACDADAPERISERSWYVTAAEVKSSSYDLKATNPNLKPPPPPTPHELLAIIEEAQGEIQEGLAQLRGQFPPTR